MINKIDRTVRQGQVFGRRNGRSQGHAQGRYLSRRRRLRHGGAPKEGISYRKRKEGANSLLWPSRPFQGEAGNEATNTGVAMPFRKPSLMHASELCDCLVMPWATVCMIRNIYRNSRAPRRYNDAMLLLSMISTSDRESRAKRATCLKQSRIPRTMRKKPRCLMARQILLHNSPQSASLHLP